MYGGYGSYGGYGGYGGSSLSSYGGYGSSYGGYGGYGNSYGLNRLNSNDPNQPNNQDPNRPPQQINQRKALFQEYFKMMGGLRSMVEIGFCMVALCNFGSRSWKLLKKLVLFLMKGSKKLFYKLSGAHYLTEKMVDAFEKAMLLSPNSKNGHTLANKVLMGIRIAAAIILLIGVKLRARLNNEVQKQHDEMLKKYEGLKLEQQKIVQKQHQLEQMSMHQKEGYF